MSFKWTNPPGSRNLSIKLTKLTPGIAICLGLLTGITQIAVDFVQQGKIMDANLQAIFLATNKPAIDAITDSDRVAALNLVDNLMQYAFIDQATLIDNKGDRLASSIRSSHEPDLAERMFSLFFDGHRTYSFQLQGHSINSASAKLPIVVDKHQGFAAFYQRSLLIVLSGVIRNLVFGLILAFAFHIAIVRSLAAASEIENKIPLDNKQAVSMGVLYPPARQRSPAI